MGVGNGAELRKENTLNPQFKQIHDHLGERENISDYVAHLQLHMALQARNLVPTLKTAADNREMLLQQTQATFEKFVSRQAI